MRNTWLAIGLFCGFLATHAEAAGVGSPPAVMPEAQPMLMLGVALSTAQVLVWDDRAGEYQLRRAGDELAGGRIVEVLQDHVIIDAGGVRQVLALAPPPELRLRRRRTASGEASAGPPANAALGAAPAAAAVTPFAAAPVQGTAPVTEAPPPSAGTTAPAPALATPTAPAAPTTPAAPAPLAGAINDNPQVADVPAVAAAPDSPPAPSAAPDPGMQAELSSGETTTSAAISSPSTAEANPPASASPPSLPAASAASSPATVPATPLAPPAASVTSDVPAAARGSNAPSVNPVPAPAQLPSGVVIVQPFLVSMDRSTFNAQLTNFETIAEQVTLAPAAGGGFQLASLRSGSFLETIGLRAGDIVLRVDGRPLNTVEDAARAYAWLRVAGQSGGNAGAGGNLTIDALRNGLPIQLRLHLIG